MSFWIFALLIGQVFGYCPSDSLLITDLGSCFFFANFPAKGDDAEQFCHFYDGHLVNVENAFENSIVASYALKEIGNVQILLGLQHNTTNDLWLWRDGTNATYFHWAAGQPDSGGCVALNIEERTWRTIDCATPLPFVCRFAELQTTTPHTTTPDPDAVCEDGWKYFAKTDMCYLHGREMSYYEAEDFCQEHRGHLASIHSQEENDFVRDLAYNTTCDRNGNRWLYGVTVLGGQVNETSNETMWWTDGSAPDFTARLCSSGSGSEGNYILMQAYPPECFEKCADGAWVVTPFESTDGNKWPEFVCKAKPMKELHLIDGLYSSKFE
ncbi:unnamed protein product, partial [Mesorhabditis spiculigera]